jgi:hypothetical protein
MLHQQDSPKYWQRWLRDSAVTDSVARQINEIYRALRGAHERMWAVAYGGAVGGAVIAVLVAVPILGYRAGWLRVALVALVSASTVSVSLWAVYWLMRRLRMRSVASLLTGHELQGEDTYLERVITAIADGLARSNYRPRDEQVEMDQLTQATIVTGLREAPTSELERTLLERLVGSSYVSTADGSVFVFKLGPNCKRCQARTRTGPLRLLNVPGHWAAENGYQRLRDLPTCSQYLRTVPTREQDLTQFLGKSAGQAEPTMYFGPRTEVVLCEACAKEARKLGVLEERDKRWRQTRSTSPDG